MKKSNTHAKTALTAIQKRRQQTEEVKTKLRNLPQIAKEEILDEVVSGQLVTRQFGSFANFLRDQSVIGIGIGLVFGTQTKTVVDSIMKSLVNPLTSLFLPGQQSLADKTIRLNFHGRHADIVWGAIVYNLFSFVMVAIVVYVIYRLFRLEKLAKKM